MRGLRSIAKAHQTLRPPQGTVAAGFLAQAASPMLVLSRATVASRNEIIHVFRRRTNVRPKSGKA